jgi:hypothetical protein
MRFSGKDAANNDETPPGCNPAGRNRSTSSCLGGLLVRGPAAGQFTDEWHDIGAWWQRPSES